MSVPGRIAAYLPKITKAITAAAGAAAAVLTTAASKPEGIGLTDVELAIGAFVVVGFLAWLFPNKAA